MSTHVHTDIMKMMLTNLVPLVTLLVVIVTEVNLTTVLNVVDLYLSS